MKLLVINCGSSSIKFKLYRMPAEEVLCSGLLERIGSETPLLNYTAAGRSTQQELPGQSTHQAGLRAISDMLMHPDHGVITSVDEIGAVGHRVVHGGTTFSDTTQVTEAVKQKIEQLSMLAPLHNPVNLQGIQLAEEIFPQSVQVAVFDTAFHQTIPPVAKKFAIPNTFYEKHHIQGYGFHGTSHRYVSERALEFLDNPDAKLVTIHLGNGCSMTAVDQGKSVDHSMGFAPANGLIMGTRSGDIDHSLIFYLVDTLGYELQEVNELLNKESGMLGLTGYSDLREVQAAAEKGDANCQLALAMNAYRIKKYIGAYAAAMNGLDALVFTAGIGENSVLLREKVCTAMDYLGIELDPQRNEQPKRGSLQDISTDNSRVRILVIPTDEEVEIARQAYQLVG